MISPVDATKKAAEAVAGSAVKDYKRESTTARLVGAGKSRRYRRWS
jgi:hypothetical protein